ncbi:IONOTROPIC GLUTAMATE RECEPTOR [Salix purpurea]|uniref:Glutamate receptor n=1 Tax=Salix purpurea TaxID=77065 RepID=A0A9Q0WMT5_SALPP|nr:IONOTROPIC GLUTAMATE RECEPTOR [Salix purpurea]
MKRTNLLAKENSQLTRSLISFNEVLKPSILLSVFITFLLILSNGVEAAASTNKVTNIGAIIDGTSRTAKEEKTAMEIAVQNFNSISRNHKLSLHFKNPQADPLQAAYAAQELIKEKKVEVIIGMDKWEEASLVASIRNQSQVPILSFAAPARTPILTSLRWPFLIRMASDGSEQMRCIAALVHFYNWRRVVVVYEDDVFGRESGNLALLTEALQEVGSEIDYRLVLPQLSNLTDPKDVVQDELIKLQKRTESRVFIVLQSSLPMLTNLFGEAKKEGLVGNDSVWIIANSIASFLDSLNNSVISSMEGTLGIKTYYSSNSSFKKFEALFQKTFKSEYVDEDNFQPGIQALRAYDSIGVITQAIEKLGSNTTSPKMILNSLLESDFIGLSGRIRFKDGMLSDAPTLRVVNVAGKKYEELDFWLPNCGFSDTLYVDEDKGRCRNSDGGKTSGGLAGPVIWPGDLTGRDPKGWAMPSAEKPLKIVVPKRTSYDKFVTFRTGEERPVGFCIDLFDEVVMRLNYSLPPVFVTFDGLYPDLVKGVYNKTYDAAIGDITILSERAELVEFTQPYAESGLSMIVPLKTEDTTWLFLKPFGLDMWIVSERLHSNLTRVVVVVWLFVVFILTSSYTASLTSKLTVQRLEPNFSDFQKLKNDKLNVGCENDSFILKYLEDVLGFENDKIKIFDLENDDTFEKYNIAAAFVELPYGRLFLDRYCKSYTSTRSTYRFGGFGFAFQKGSPIAADFSREILSLSEDGYLTKLEEKWFVPVHGCSRTSATNNNAESLSLRSFKGIYIVSAAISAICFLLSLIRLLRNSRPHQVADVHLLSPGSGFRATEKFYYGEQTRVLRRASTFAQALDKDARGSPKWKYVSNFDNF